MLKNGLLNLILIQKYFIKSYTNTTMGIPL